MNEKQKLAKLLLKLLRGSPLIAACLVAGLMLARFSIHSTTPVYESAARIRLDDNAFGISNARLYKDFDVFSTKNKIMTEVEMISSPVLVAKAVDRMGIQVDYFRVSRFAEREIYGENPFIVLPPPDSGALNEQRIDVSIMLPDTVVARLASTGEEVRGLFGQKLLLAGQVLRFQRNDALLAKRTLDLAGTYAIRIRSKKALVREFKEALDVVAMDKETPILRVGFSSHSPHKAADVANAVCATYMEDYVEHKSKAAKETVDFIDEQLNVLALKLASAENDREQYRRTYGIINTRQETETAMRKISDLQKALINLDIKEREVQLLEAYIREGRYFEDEVPPFGFGDLTYTELVKKLALYRDERIDLVELYQEGHPQLKALDQKIEQTVAYVREALATQRRLIEHNRSDLDSAVQKELAFFEPIPTREKELHILERRNQLLEIDYNFLTKKRAEAAITAASNISFHRVIEKATPPRKPVKPNAVLITFMSGMFGLLAGIGLVFLLGAVFGKVRDAHDLHNRSVLPVLGSARPGECYTADYDRLASMLDLQHPDAERLCIAVTSLGAGEGKTDMAEGLYHAYQRSEFRTVLLRTNGHGHRFGHTPPMPQNLSPARAKAWIDQAAGRAERVIIDCRSLAEGPEVPGLVRAGGLGLVVAQTGTTPLDRIARADDWAESIGATEMLWAVHLVTRMTRITENWNALRARLVPQYRKIHRRLYRLLPQWLRRHPLPQGANRHPSASHSATGNSSF